MGNTRAAWHWMRTDPAPAARTERHHRLKGELARGEAMDRRQIEVTAGGRVWYLLDVTVWNDRASTGHTCIFDHYRLGGRATVRVHTGIGDDMRRDVYQDRRAYVWDNRFDTATLRCDHGPQAGSPVSGERDLPLVVFTVRVLRWGLFSASPTGTRRRSRRSRRSRRV
ncbi:hypothetical protein [Streptomyces sp. NPDC056690]|uniref:hypothetical protein n=1 Tax=unclassified Streptomyces TaxID=2593676 RepID=UPI00363E3B27